MSKKKSQSKKKKPQPRGGHREACSCQMCTLQRGIDRSIFV